MKNLLKISFLVILTSFWACKEKNEPTLNPEQEQAKSVNADRKEADDNYQSTQDFAQKAMESSQIQAREATPRTNKNFDTYPFSDYNSNGCASVTIEGASTSPNAQGLISRTITLDFGTQGCVGTDGRSRKGKVIYTYLRPASTGAFNPFDNVGTAVNVVFDNHYVNNIKLEGNTRSTCTMYSLTGLGTTNINLVKSDSVVVTGGKLIYPDNSTQLWNCAYKRDFSLQFGVNFTPNLSTGIFTMTGNNNGVNRQGISHNTILGTGNDKLLWKWSCLTGTAQSIEPNVFNDVVLPVQGKMTMTWGQNNTALFDFGSGACDNQYSLTINGTTIVVTQ